MNTIIEEDMGKLEGILFNFFISKHLRSEKVIEWEGIITKEGANKFIESLYKTYPIAERIYHGAHGGGIPMPSCLIPEYNNS